MKIEINLMSKNQYEKNQTRSDCVQEQLKIFRDKEPKHAEVVEFILKGFDTEEVRLIIGRSYGATREVYESV